MFFSHFLHVLLMKKMVTSCCCGRYLYMCLYIVSIVLTTPTVAWFCKEETGQRLGACLQYIRQ